jgi:hypothetical protein
MGVPLKAKDALGATLFTTAVSALRRAIKRVLIRKVADIFGSLRTNALSFYVPDVERKIGLWN